MSDKTRKQSPTDSGSPYATVGRTKDASRSRVLACIHCQKRKIKCDRQSPCENCVQARLQCVQAVQAPYQRRRRYAEKDLLHRLRQYEGLLRENHVNFDPLHPVSNEEHQDIGTSGIPSKAHTVVSSESVAPDSTTTRPERSHEPTDIWNAMNQGSPTTDADDAEDDSEANPEILMTGAVRETVIRRAMDDTFDNGGQLLFGATTPGIDLSMLHPNHAHLFKLWQIYVDNVDPLLKVTHGVTLQSRIVDASSNMSKISPPLEALMFAIYGAAIGSLPEEQCLSLFAVSRTSLLETYQLGSQQALSNCGFLRSNDRDCLTAFLLYLVAGRTSQDPRAQSAMLGALLRVAQRMGLHLESANVRHTPFEAEMRRRLWWAIVAFDARSCERSDFRSTILIPTWDCRLPSNVNDFDLRPDMKTSPLAYEGPSQALFVVVRSHLHNTIRRTDFHLDFINPSLKALVQDTEQKAPSQRIMLTEMEKAFEKQYLDRCNPDDPLHYMTIWTTRGFFAKCRLLEYYTRTSKPGAKITATERNEACNCAIQMIKYDTMVTLSALTQGFLWLMNLHFPFLAHIHLIQDMRRRPTEDHIETAWDAINANYMARKFEVIPIENPYVSVLAGNVLQAWQTCQATRAEQGRPLRTPAMIINVQFRAEQLIAKKKEKSQGCGNSGAEPGTGPAFDAASALHSGQQTSTGLLPDLSTQSLMDIDLSDFDLAGLDWSSTYT